MIAQALFYLVWQIQWSVFFFSFFLLFSPFLRGVHLGRGSVFYSAFIFLIKYKLKFHIFTLLGMCRGTPFLRKASAVSGWPHCEAMCMSVLPSFVLAKTLALNLSTNNSTTPVFPHSAATCRGDRSSWNIKRWAQNIGWTLKTSMGNFIQFKKLIEACISKQKWSYGVSVSKD